MSYARVGELDLYHAEHGPDAAGVPLVLLHGGLGSGEDWAPVLGDLAAGRRVITVDLQGHGRTADIDRPLRAEDLADDIAALLGHLGLEQADVMGYSLGGVVALRLAIQHPSRVRRLVLVSVAFARDGNFPEVVAQMDQMRPETAELMVGSPPHAQFTRLAPRPEDWGTLVARTSDLLKVDYDWRDEAAAVTAPVLLVYADADSIRPAHVAECFALFGGGLRDASWDGSQRPASGARLAVLPGRTHYDVAVAPALAPAVVDFLDAAA